MSHQREEKTDEEKHRRITVAHCLSNNLWVVGVCLEGDAERSDHLCKCAICSGTGEAVVNTEAYFLIFSCLQTSFMYFVLFNVCQSMQFLKSIALPTWQLQYVSFASSHGGSLVIICRWYISVISQLSKVNDLGGGQEPHLFFCPISPCCWVLSFCPPPPRSPFLFQSSIVNSNLYFFKV